MYTLDEEMDVNFQILSKLKEMLYFYLILVNISTEAAIVVYFLVLNIYEL